MAVIAAWRTGLTTLLTAGTWRFGGREDGRRVGWVSWGGFALRPKSWRSRRRSRGRQEFDFGLEFADTGAGALMHALPVTGLLAQFEVFGEQRTTSAAWRRGRVALSTAAGEQRGGSACAATFIQPV